METPSILKPAFEAINLGYKGLQTTCRAFISGAKAVRGQLTSHWAKSQSPQQTSAEEHLKKAYSELNKNQQKILCMLYDSGSNIDYRAEQGKFIKIIVDTADNEFFKKSPEETDIDWKKLENFVDRNFSLAVSVRLNDFADKINPSTQDEIDIVNELIELTKITEEICEKRPACMHAFQGLANAYKIKIQQEKQKNPGRNQRFQTFTA